MQEDSIVNSGHILWSTRGKGDEKMGCDYYTPEKKSAIDFQDRQTPMASVYHFLKSNLTSYVRLLRVKIYISFKIPNHPPWQNMDTTSPHPIMGLTLPPSLSGLNYLTLTLRHIT